MGTVLPKSITGAFSNSSISRLDVREVERESVTALPRYFGIKFLSLDDTVKKKENLDVWPLSVENDALLTCNFTS